MTIAWLICLFRNHDWRYTDDEDGPIYARCKRCGRMATTAF